MGATDIQISGRGRSMDEAFSRLQQEATEAYGDDLYNGTISTIYEVTDVTAEWEASGLRADEFLNQADLMDKLDKRECNAVCVRPPTSEAEGEYLFVGWAAE